MARRLVTRSLLENATPKRLYDSKIWVYTLYIGRTMRSRDEGNECGMLNGDVTNPPEANLNFRDENSLRREDCEDPKNPKTF